MVCALILPLSKTGTHLISFGTFFLSYFIVSYDIYSPISNHSNVFMGVSAANQQLNKQLADRWVVSFALHHIDVDVSSK